MSLSSIFPKPEVRTRAIKTENNVVGGSTVTMQLNKDSLIEEHLLLISYSEAFAPVPTAFNAAEVGRLIRSVRLNVAGVQAGELVNCDGLMAHIQSTLRENQPVPNAVLAAISTTTFCIELHYENDGSKMDFLSMLDGTSATQVTLDIEFGSAADSALVFTGGVSGGAPTFSVEVVSQDYNPTAFVDSDNVLLPEFGGVASSRHFLKQKPANAAALGNQTVLLEIGNATRGILLACENAAGALSDTIVSQISLVINGEQHKVGSFNAFRELTKSKNGLNVPGVMLIDFGDDERGFLNLFEVNQAQLDITFTGAGSVRVLQDYSI